MPTPPDPSQILQTGLGFWASKTLLSAVELEVFTHLARGPLALEPLEKTVGLHPRGGRDFLDTLVALGFLRRENGIYANTPETDAFLDKAKPSYVGGILEMANNRLYPFWGHLTEALRTGLPQNESKHGGNLFDTLADDPERLEEFMRAMSGVSRGANMAIARQFPWANYRTFVDAGTAQGDLAAQIALANPHLTGIGFDLPGVRTVCEKYLAALGLSDRVKFVAGSFFTDPLPLADVVLYGHILHDWNLEEKQLLLRKAWDALPAGGAVVVYDSIIDDDRSKNAFGLMMSLNMLVETPGGFDYTGADCQAWMREAGFQETRVEALGGPEAMVIGIK